MEDAAIQPWTRQVSPKLQHVYHPLPSCRRVQMDVRVSCMHVFPWQVHTCGQVLGNSNLGGKPLRKGLDGVPAPIVAIHLPPLQGGHNEGGVDGCNVSEDLKAPDHLIYWPKTCLNLLSMSRDIAVTLGQHVLLLSFPLLQVAFGCVTPVLLLFFLFLLPVCQLVSGRNEDFLLSWLTLTAATLAMTPVHTPALLGQLVTLPGKGLGALVWVEGSRR